MTTVNNHTTPVTPFPHTVILIIFTPSACKMHFLISGEMQVTYFLPTIATCWLGIIGVNMTWVREG